MIPADQRRAPVFSVFNSKRTVFVFRTSATLAKHFMHETEKDWANKMHGNWGINPSVRVKKSACILSVSLDRQFYYSGDTIKALVLVDAS